ncbi:peptidoglycan-binding domain-containing protein [Roseovarius pacificus]|uniref:peptidoglycan-binding domain-containing protein n=1 Tax=Roseovarius pacificus TaxID=337701 RepID=UPI00403A67AB
MISRTAFSALLACGLLMACNPDVPSAVNEPEIVQTLQEAPPGAPPGTCWGKDTAPAVIETETRQVLLQPAQVLDDGTVLQPAIYKTETRQAILRERKVTWFQTPCPREQTPDFIASLQRALKVRGHYRGPIMGRMDSRTRAAIRAFQAPQGLDSGILSLETARQLGLAVVEDPLSPD